MNFCSMANSRTQWRSENGPDIPQPDLRVEIAQCEREAKMHDMCGVHYLRLTG